MSTSSQANIFERLFFLGYHVIAFIVTLFGLNYLSLPQPDVSLALQKMISPPENAQEIKAQRELNVPSISELTGTVLVYEDEFSGSDREAALNDHLKSGYTIETKEGSALIHLGKDRAVSIRILPGTIIKLDELKASKVTEKENSEHTLLSLVQGQIIARSEVPDNVIIDVRTKNARFSLKNSLSAIATDNKTFYFMVVKEGAVRAENSDTLKFDMTPAKHSFFVDAEGNERRSDLPAPLKFFEWNLHKVQPQELTADIILAATGGPLKVNEESVAQDPNISAELLADLEAQVKKGMIEFTDVSNKLKSTITSEQVSLDELRKRHEKEALKIYADITCLETSKQCDLYSEKLLLSRGFGRLHNSSRMAAAIIKDLKLYLEEQAKVRAEREKEVKALVDLENKRKETMAWVQSRLADKTRLQEILTKLTDQSLIP